MLPDKPTGPEGERKKSSKPVMEKKRRARINASLAELKSLQLEIIKKEGTRHSKMEKADILELTVRHLKQLQKQQISGPALSDSSRENKYRLGFSDCVSEMHQFLSVNQGIDPNVKVRLLNHLATIARSSSESQNETLQTVQPIKSPHPTNQHQSSDHVIPIVQYQSSYPMTMNCLNSNGPIISGASIVQSSPSRTTVICQPVKHSSSSTVSSSTDNQTLNSLKILPTRLPNGEMAFVLPASVPMLSSSSIANYVIPVFTTSDVIPNPVPSGPLGSHQIPVTTINPSACLSQCVPVQDTSNGIPLHDQRTASCSSLIYSVSPDVKSDQVPQGLCPSIPETLPDSTRPETDSNKVSNFDAHSRKNIPETAPPAERDDHYGRVNAFTDTMWRPW